MSLRQRNSQPGVVSLFTAQARPPTSCCSPSMSVSKYILATPAVKTAAQVIHVTALSIFTGADEPANDDSSRPSLFSIDSRSSSSALSSSSISSRLITPLHGVFFASSSTKIARNLRADRHPDRPRQRRYGKACSFRGDQNLSLPPSDALEGDEPEAPLYSRRVLQHRSI